MSISELQSTLSRSYVTTDKEQKSSSTSKKSTDTTLKSGNVNADTYEKSCSTPKATYEKPKGLSDDAIEALKEAQAESKKNLLSQMMQLNTAYQTTNEQFAKQNAALFTEIFGSKEAALPPLATTKEGALAAISEGGAYSVDSVATRIMDMATALSGGDLSKLSLLKESVQKGFEQAGLKFKEDTNQKLPQICQDTYAEIMKRFETLEKNFPSDTGLTKSDTVSELETITESGSID